MTVHKALTVAGSDSGGGAGIQADLKTFQELGVYGMSVLTALTAQNTQGVHGVFPVPPEFIAQQMDAVLSDIGTDAVKTGMLFNSIIIETVAKKLKEYNVRNYVLDPVMVAKGGAPLLVTEAVAAVKEHLLPLATVVTPNLPEAKVLTGMEKIETKEEMKEAAKLLHDWGAQHVVIKGGHGTDDIVTDLLYDGREFVELSAERFHTQHTHGTGCTFAAAIAAGLASGKNVREAVKQAKVFITAAISHPLGIGHGHGPTNHWAYRREGSNDV
ncbi:bifunctional hydroxymethylpyrimidine kinase/phosphomethylpyrimidine kinase [Aneurinibacillus thermoaerophilus]|uniref:Hydroxymethylpyrimidine/phosphomethylpyrimidine kinase n=1 Tax=Aneurinibacillus thermoaerophilus TaxID=143495 RepID=A0A1G7ZLG0_ANETH|nr:MULTISPECIES: bifunctional hydroxymethylpyrimidine kinase/phosphomethylpyrimidine kinase [Aneurinibacillus]AMA72434.1 hydroxymethylpyrimidine/phosphomethylpyrimidine kinase [Aneurinibacillus sp. XH2]MED0675687.1 bifunctional hydroxymethylpyrimidine kinase/phosphomethylpyrimidine kinase [Aneurinibacillus thermoaerophilus]MED0758785.1 bifunctional hydroxymethylpyrimidine kinase/phosphomethylpyrimidine kinase [Aneurinibacillus thermoaerophilus]MED0759439.1 bifunctional hydroxymethylpyrimidine k